MKTKKLDMKEIRKIIAKDLKELQDFKGKDLEEKISYLRKIYACAIANLLTKGLESSAKTLVPFYAYLNNLDKYLIEKNYREIVKNYKGGK